MDGQVIHILNTNEIEGLADPSLQQYECSLYIEKGNSRLKVTFDICANFLSLSLSRIPFLSLSSTCVHDPLCLPAFLRFL